MRFDLVTIFPEMSDAVTRFGVTGRAMQKGLWHLRTWNPRDYATDAWRRVDDRPFGGGPGMVMLAQPLIDNLKAIRADRGDSPSAPVVCLSPQGRPFSDRMARELAQSQGAILIAGRYEAIDQRFIDAHVDAEWSVGDFVVSGGELPAMMVIDAAVRYVPGALNDPDSAHQDSFAGGLLDCPHYTRPESLDGVEVPNILLSGHHARIAQWRREQALRSTRAKRPDLIEQARRDGALTPSDEALLRRLGADDPSV